MLCKYIGYRFHSLEECSLSYPNYTFESSRKTKMTQIVHVFALYYIQLFKSKHGCFRIK